LAADDLRLQRLAIYFIRMASSAFRTAVHEPEALYKPKTANHAAPKSPESDIGIK
jgi:hypothetical protein